MSSLKERVKSLQADTTNTDTALTTLEEALAEKVGDRPRFLTHTHTHTLCLSPRESRITRVMRLGWRRQRKSLWQKGEELPVLLIVEGRKIHFIVGGLSICCWAEWSPCWRAGAKVSRESAMCYLLTVC